MAKLDKDQLDKISGGVGSVQPPNQHLEDDGTGGGGASGTSDAKLGTQKDNK